HYTGLRYLSGDGVKKDTIAALMWLTLSARAGDRGAAKDREKLASRLPSAERQEAESLADKWRPKQASAGG
ncbi:MAG: hypothetical protein ACREF6_01265, partial [Alphaproteobacteria bacterium]